MKLSSNIHTKNIPARTVNCLPYEEAQLKGMFMRFDENGDGRLSKEELRKAFKGLGSHVPGLQAFFALFCTDRNGDGTINDDELDILVKYALKFGYSIK
ncbi:hypothetical protein TIFTF001_005134 [Ficus carica]|uniref:EF-hand domain-containing protein n=1 Tax=Ficus carica TaxID=3494 RepID=A0AA88CY89_FICCA|nr:hypothetical protein TIFTF001_005134 [Ficus carica]